VSGVIGNVGGGRGVPSGASGGVGRRLFGLAGGGVGGKCGAAQSQAPATCLVVTLRRLKTLVVAIERIRAASAGSS